MREDVKACACKPPSRAFTDLDDTGHCVTTEVRSPSVLCGSQTFPFLIVLPLVERVFSAWDITTAGIGAEILGSALFWLQLIVIYLFAFGAR